MLLAIDISNTRSPHLALLPQPGCQLEEMSFAKRGFGSWQVALPGDML